MKILGLHHITIVTADAQRNIDFYTRVLGLRLVKKTVNFDAPTTYHLYYGDETGRPGTAITFFEWPRVPHGKPGIGGTHHFALAVKDETALLMWKRYLTDQGVKVTGPLDRHYFKSLYLRDPDGTIVELATLGPGMAIDEPADALGTSYKAPPEQMSIDNRDEAAINARTWSEPVPEIIADMALSYGMHHISAISSDIRRTDQFYREVLGLDLVKMTSNFDDPDSAHWYWGVEGGRPGSLITYFERPRGSGYAQMGTGQTHHFAFAVADTDEQREWIVKLSKAGYRASPIQDRTYFQSVYTSDPDGHIVELATVGPGFPVDEPIAELGTHLMLPAWLESERTQIETGLTPVEVPLWRNPAIT